MYPKLKQLFLNLLMVCLGEEVIIAKNNLPLVELIVYQPKSKRKLGLLAGQIKIPDDFMEEDDGVNSMFYGYDS